MDLLRKEMERKRQAVLSAKKSSNVGRIVATTADNTTSSTSSTSSDRRNSSQGTKKKTYLKTADLYRFQEEREEEERKKRQLAMVQHHQQQLGKKRRRRDGDDEERRSVREEGRDREGMIDGGTGTVRGSGTDTVGSCSSFDGTSSAHEPIGSDAAVTTTTTIKHNESGTNASLDGGESTTASPPPSPSHSHTRTPTETEETDMTGEEITLALRSLGIPVRLFGESNDSTRYIRLCEARENRKAELAGMSEMDDFRLGSGHGIRNPFLGGKKGRKDAEEGLTGSSLSAGVVTGINITGAVPPVASSSSTSRTNGPGDGTTSNEHNPNLRQTLENDDDDNDDPHKTIHRFFKLLLRHWEDELLRRPDSVKRTAAGRNETKTLKQCKDYVRPLFKLCKTRRLEENMMGKLLGIVKFCKAGEFVKAHDAYIDVAIGRAAWPIGVTMVGIHARSGRARIESSNVAHVMNSELQRKYLTSVKRLITYCQRKRVDVAPSKKVNNV